VIPRVIGNGSLIGYMCALAFLTKHYIATKININVVR